MTAAAAIALGACGDGGGGGGGGPGPQPVPVANLRALHNPASARYDGECIKCHGDIPEEATLSTAVPGVHPMMLQQVGGETDTTCVRCHVTVDFDSVSAGNVRRNVDVNICAACHATGGGGYPFYFR
jgi:hypothetical protein